MHEFWFGRFQVMGEQAKPNATSGVQEQAEPFENDAGDDFRRYFAPDQIAAIEAGLADAEAGRTYSHEEVVSELRDKYGW